MKDLYLLRHGRASSGPSAMDRDFHLTELGRQQAHAAGAELAKVAGSLSAIYSSRLTRARETAEIVKTYLDTPLHLFDDLHEHGAAVFLLDCSADEAARQHPDKIDATGAVIYKQGFTPGLNWEFSAGGETLRQLHHRAKTAYQAILARHPGAEEQCLIVSHGSFLSALLSELLGLPLRSIWSFQFANAAWMHVRFFPSDATGELLPSIVIHNPLQQQTFERSEKITQANP